MLPFAIIGTVKHDGWEALHRLLQRGELSVPGNCRSENGRVHEDVQQHHRGQSDIGPERYAEYPRFSRECYGYVKLERLEQLSHDAPKTEYSGGTNEEREYIEILPLRCDRNLTLISPSSCPS